MKGNDLSIKSDRLEMRGRSATSDKYILEKKKKRLGDFN